MTVCRRMTAVVCMALAAAAVADEGEPTLKDLRRTLPEIRAGERVEPDAQRARELYQEFLELEAGDPALQTEALRRLGDLQLEAGEAERGEVPTPGAGTAETRAAIAVYERVLQEQPGYPRADVVLYQLSRAWEAEGDPGRALGYLDELVWRFPHSRHVDEAQFRRGEILFSGQRWREAEEAYAAVMQAGPASEFFEQALYKHGWALFKQSATEPSAQSFLTLLDRKLAGGQPGQAVAPEDLPRADQEVVADTLRALSIQFAALEAGASLDAAVTRHGRVDYAWLLYGALGDMLLEKERYTDGADTYRAFVRRDPAHRRAPGLQGRAIDAYLKGGFGDLALEGKREFIRQYGFDGPFWQSRSREDAPEVVAQLKASLQDVARYHHATAQASGARADYEQAAGWYRRYLANFPNEPDSAETNYLLADTLYESQDFRAAALEYARSAYEYPAGELSAKAGYAALVAYERHEVSLPPEGRAEWHAAGIDTALRFASTFPQHPEAARMRLRSAQQIFNLKDYERASSVAQLVVAEPATLAAAEVQTAWNVAADSAFELGHYAEAEGAYTRVLGLMPADGPARGTISERLAASVYKQGEARQLAGDTDGAVAAFLRVGQVAPDSPIRVNADFDAAALLVQARQWDRAIPVLEAFRRGYPDSPLAASVPKSLALAYGESGRPLAAAAEFERVADDAAETDAVRRAALVEAAQSYEQGGDASRAAMAWTRFVERYPEPIDESMGVRSRLADMALKAGDPAGRQRWLEEIVKADAAAGPARTDASRLMAAGASLELAGSYRVAFEAVRLEAPLAKSLKAKRAAMEKALSSYQAAADYGIAEVATAATFATAELYRRLAADLLASERPAGLGTDELEQYELLLEEQAYPFEERAIELHEANAARVADGLYDESVRASFEALAALKPARFSRQELPAAVAADGPLGEALAAAEGGDWAAAEQAFTRALEAGALAPALTGLGLSYRHTGRFGLAAEAYRGALAADPAYGPALLNLGVLLDLYQQQPAEALIQYRGYQATLPEPDARVANWIREVEIRAGGPVQRVEVTP